MGKIKDLPYFKTYLFMLIGLLVLGASFFFYFQLSSKASRESYEIVKTIEDSNLKDSGDSKRLIKSLKSSYEGLDLDFTYSHGEATFYGKWKNQHIEYTKHYVDENGYDVTVPKVIRDDWVKNGKKRY